MRSCFTLSISTVDPGQALAAAILNVVPSLVYEKINPDVQRLLNQSRGKARGRDNEPKNRPYCTYHQTYSHGTNDCMLRPYHIEPSSLYINKRNSCQTQMNAPQNRSLRMKILGIIIRTNRPDKGIMKIKIGLEVPRGREEKPEWIQEMTLLGRLTQ